MACDIAGQPILLGKRPDCELGDKIDVGPEDFQSWTCDELTFGRQYLPGQPSYTKAAPLIFKSVYAAVSWTPQSSLMTMMLNYCFESERRCFSVGSMVGKGYCPMNKCLFARCVRV